LIMIDQFVYIRDDEYHWIPALLHDQTAEKATVSVGVYRQESELTGDGDAMDASRRVVKRTVKLADYPNKALPLQNVVDGKLKCVEDMIELSFLHEAAILYTLKSRHVKSLPYTRTGDIVIAVNPYQWFPSLYQEENRLLYSRNLVWEASKKEYDPRKDLPPHVYETSALAYRGLAMAGIHQSILVSGESGAGKTETVKICMHHLASVVQKEHEQDGDSSQDQTVITKVLDSNPLLEAFGNAKTRRNDNSSRFGKYVRLQFQRGTHDTSHLTLLGSESQVYLLEKSRVVRHDEAERTFHIFYQLLAAPNEIKTKFWSKLEGTNYSSFAYVGDTDTNNIEGLPDADHFRNTVQSLSIIGIEYETLETLMRAICVVLQLGNILFGPHPDDSDHSVITSKQTLKDLADLMGIPDDKLSTTLTQRLVTVRREEMSIPLSQEAAKDSVDSLAKQIYHRIFLWLVRRINQATTSGRREGDDQFGIIGLLDIFGFESFPVNSFEQLCINYANEQLQQKFTKDVFVSVFEEYKEEGISLDEIHYDDNTHVLDLIQNSSGLLAMLNEECIRPNGSDYGFVNKAIHANKTSPALIIPRISQNNVEFGIRHYAGDVMYDATAFVTKNQDTLPSDLMEAACASSNTIISEELMATASVQSPTKPVKRTSNLVSPTVWSKYKSQLRYLMADLQQSESRYIRCIKPNSFKMPRMMEHKLTLEQLRSSGVISAVTLARSAFPNRLEHSFVLERFYMLWPSGRGRGSTNNKVECDNLLALALKPLQNGAAKAFVIGNSRAYFRAGALEYLEAARLKGIEKPARLIQAVIRGFLARKMARRLRANLELKKIGHWNGQALLIQLAWRCYRARRARRKIRRKAKARKKQIKAAVRIQCNVRIFLSRKEREKRYLQRTKAEAKRRKKQRKLKKMGRTATVIQKYTRGAIIRMKYGRLLDNVRRRPELLARLEEMKLQAAKHEKKSRKQLEKAEKVLQKERSNRKSWEDSVLEMQEQNALDQTSKVIDYLAKERRSLLEQVDTVESGMKSVKKSFDHLMAENDEMREEYNRIQKKNEEIKALNKTLTEKRDAAEKKAQKVEQEIRHMSLQFLPIHTRRNDFNNALEEILELIESNRKHSQLKEDVALLGIGCEAKIEELISTESKRQNVKQKRPRMLGGSFSHVPAPKTPSSARDRKKKKKRVTISGTGLAPLTILEEY
jgi:myosin-5